MRWQKVKHIFCKEVLDTLRDRRTILMMIVIPVLLYPTIMILVNELASSQQAKMEQKTVKIALINVPDDSVLLQRIRSADRLVIRYTKTPMEDVKSGAAQFVLEMPAGYEDALAQSRTAVARLHYDRANEDATTNLDRILDIVDSYNDEVLAARLKAKSLDEQYVKPLEVREVNVASSQKMGGFIIGRFLPMLMVIMVLAGSIYPAIDMTAGEKERGTLETILTSPATRAEIVIGKFLTVTLIALITGLLNLGSMSATFAFGIFKQVSEAYQIHIPFSYLLIMIFCLVPLAVFFSGIMMAISSFARSFKEAQNLITPAYLMATMPAMISSIPGIQLEGFWLTMPIANVTLLFKELMLGVFDVQHILIVFFCVLFFAAVSLFAAVKLFGREEVLFGEVTSFGLSFKRSNILPKPVPEAAESLFFLMLAMTLMLYAAIPAQAKSLTWGLAFTELGVFLAFPIAFAVYLKLDFVETFRLRAPAPRFLAAAFLMFVGAEFCAATIMALQNRIFPVPQELINAMEKLLQQSANQPLWLIVLVSAVLPAICEEMTFRGITLSGFASRMPPATALVLTGAVFAAFHLSLHRFVPIFLLGWGISYLVWKSGSIFPGMLLHLLNNGFAAIAVNYPQIDRFGLLEMQPSFRNFGIGLAFIVASLAVSGWTFRRAPVAIKG